MQKNRDRPKKSKQKKSFSLKKAFDGFTAKLKQTFKVKKQKASKQKPKANKKTFKDLLSSFKVKVKNASKPKPIKKEKPIRQKKLNSSKPGKVNFNKAISGVFIILAFVALLGLVSGMGGTKTVIKYIEVTPDIVEPDGGMVDYDTDYTVYFMGIDSLYAAAGINEGEAVTEPTHPNVEGLYFIGWADAESGGNIVSFPYAPTSDITLYPRYTETQVLGFTGFSNSSGELTWTDDIASASTYTLTETGVYTNVTSPLDEMFPFCEIEEFTDSHGNVFVKYPKCYIKFVTNSDGVIDGFKVSNVQAEEDMFIPDCFLDPSDPEGYTYLDYFALGKYEMSGTSSKGYSTSGSTCLVNVTRDQARTAARSYGDSSNYYNGYQLQDYSMTVLYNFLCMTYYKTANIQTVYGGRTGAVSSWSEASKTGTTDPIQGLNGWNTVTDCVKMLGIENPYGNVSEWCDGIVFSKTKVYMFRLPQNYSDSTTGANSFAYARPSTSGFISAFKPGNTAATKSYVFPTEASGSASTFVGDQAYYSETGTVLCVGGNWGNTSSAGLWALGGDAGASGSYANLGARLSFRPL